jgi:hypothetical protein
MRRPLSSGEARHSCAQPQPCKDAWVHPDVLLKNACLEFSSVLPKKAGAKVC